MNATTEWLRTSELREGDLVLSYGIEVRLGEIKVSASHPVIEGAGHVLYSVGVVENLDEIQAKDAWLARFILGDRRSTPERPVWVIQGNDFARWTVVR